MRTSPLLVPSSRFSNPCRPLLLLLSIFPAAGPLPIFQGGRMGAATSNYSTYQRRFWQLASPAAGRAGQGGGGGGGGAEATGGGCWGGLGLDGRSGAQVITNRRACAAGSASLLRFDATLRNKCRELGVLLVRERWGGGGGVCCVKYGSSFSPACQTNVPTRGSIDFLALLKHHCWRLCIY
ncbi:uncharacterized protein B0I36DRAFT_151605 [Microdochium trichocladiopsis]|uniref:Uncharacterized protein n=1 Tax=Microdochium trichocladiopsis TaxID=1682393 RepID=A0A9P8XZX2_9PEZI|nr:uncharacterized protein B0I36DRAFT_151605 [Microdochium trichocladiopsis]KAH7025955.1 hypothetical protein B0I36DRAFT_151605 [Microdochium trichocladiopsis]